MCGISGYAGFHPDDELLARMAATVRHRGPDGHGHWEGAAGGLAVERLALVDPAGGRQPIRSEDGAIVLGFNGEIYNHEELRDDLEARGHRFGSHSDAEVVVHLYEERGIEGVTRLRGMFGFALFDLRTRDVYLVRDRLGLKPVYYWLQDGRLLFGSELKALLASGLVAREVRPEAVDAYLRLRYVPGPGTLLRSVEKLPPAHWLRFRGGAAHLQRYWSLPPRVAGRRTDQDWLAEFEQQFAETVRLHVRGETRVGAYLSGGLDSSLLVAEAVRWQPDLQTFTVRMSGEADEAAAARAMADSARTRHHEIACSADDLLELPRVVWHADAPPSAVALPLFVLARGVRPHAKAVLSGDGADEVMSGYASHALLELLRRARAAGAGGLIQAAGWAANLARRARVDPRLDHPASLGASGWGRVQHVLREAARGPLPRVWEAAISLFDADDMATLCRRDGPLAGVVPLAATAAATTTGGAEPANLDEILGWQLDTWLPDSVLARQDKMSMAHSVEVRLPYLDHVLVEFLAQVPPHLKLRLLPLQGKVALHDLGRRRLPPALARRRKQSFTLPLEHQLETRPFRELLDRTLDGTRLAQRGYFDPRAVRALIERARASREFVTAKQLLAVILVELWHQQFIDRVGGGSPAQGGLRGLANGGDHAAPAAPE